jgi:membrane protein YqaA with SNARE-associated domain
VAQPPSAVTPVPDRAQPTAAAPLGPAASAAPADEIDLRRWFDLFLVWMIALAVLVYAGRIHAEGGDRVGLVVMVLAAYAFYLSLCNTFFPAPTTWIVMLVASNELALIGPPVLRIVVVSLLGAVATAMANLNEYHVFTFLLRYGRIGRVRETRLYRWAADWFATSPFTIIMLFSFIPVPVDVVRWLAIAYRYARSRFFVAYVIGRSLRYAAWTISAVSLDLSMRQIAIVQGVLIVAALAKVVASAVRRRRAIA